MYSNKLVRSSDGTVMNTNVPSTSSRTINGDLNSNFYLPGTTYLQPLNCSKLAESEGIEKPPHDNKALVMVANQQSPEKKLIATDICNYIIKNFPYYRDYNKGWINDIRYTLQFYDCFLKDELTSEGEYYWKLDPSSVDGNIEEVTNMLAEKLHDATRHRIRNLRRRVLRGSSVLPRIMGPWRHLGSPSPLFYNQSPQCKTLPGYTHSELLLPTPRLLPIKQSTNSDLTGFTPASSPGFNQRPGLVSPQRPDAYPPPGDLHPTWQHQQAVKASPIAVPTTTSSV